MVTVAELHSPVEIAEVRLQARVEMARRAALRKDIMGWGRALFPHKFPLPFCIPLHGYFVEIRHEPFTDTEAPRGTAKTTFKCFLVPLFQALEEPQTFQHYVNVQATEEKALSVNRSIKKELEVNEALLRLYGDMKGERWTDGQFVLRNGIVFSCLGAGGASIRGINYMNIRPDYVIVDDLYDHADINNHDSTRRKNEWFWSDLYPALAQYGKTCMHVQGTAVNQSDLLLELSSKKGVRFKSFDTITDMAKEETLWPEQKTFAQLMAQQALMPITIWEREMRNRRRDDSTSFIKRDHLAGWEYDPAWLRQTLRDGADAVREKRPGRHLIMDRVVIGNDPSVGKKNTSDFTGTCLTVITHWTDAPAERDYWIEDLREARLSVDGRIAQLQEMIEQRKRQGLIVSSVAIESIAAFEDYAQLAEARLPVRVDHINHVPDKQTNLENKSYHFQRGRVHISSLLPQEIRKTAVEQLTNNEPPHDDVRDAIFHTIDGPKRGPNLWVI